MKRLRSKKAMWGLAGKWWGLPCSSIFWLLSRPFLCLSLCETSSISTKLNLITYSCHTSHAPALFQVTYLHSFNTTTSLGRQHYYTVKTSHPFFYRWAVFLTSLCLCFSICKMGRYEAWQFSIRIFALNIYSKLLCTKRTQKSNCHFMPNRTISGWLNTPFFFSI